MTAVRVGIDAWGLSGDLLNTGFGQYTRLLLKHLPEPGLEVVAYGGPGEPRPAWLPDGVVWRPLGSRRGRLAAIESRVRLLPSAAAADAIDVFHAPAIHVRPSFPPVPRLHRPLVATVHDVIPLSHYGTALPLRLRLFYRWNLRRALAADRVVTVSAAARAEIADLTGTPPGRITVIPNAVEFEPNADRAPLRRLAVEQPYLLFAGSFEPRKNLEGAVRAFELLAGRLPHRLVAVVEPASGHAAAMHALLARSPAGGRVHLVSGLPDAELRSLYTHAEALLFPSLAEGFGFPPLQAAACDVPVVASDLPALRETIGEAADLVPVNDPAALAAGVLRVIEDGEYRRRLVERGRLRVAAHALEGWARAHRELYRDLLAGSATREPVMAARGSGRPRSG